jgi:hypothetical protein
MPRQDSCNSGQMRSRNRRPKQRNQKRLAATPMQPRRKLATLHRSKAHMEPQLTRLLVQRSLQCIGRIGLHKKSKRQRCMYYSLTNIENRRAMFGKRAGERIGQSGRILAREMNQENVLHADSTIRRMHRNQRACG